MAARIGKRGQVRFSRRDHQMAIKSFLRRAANGFDHGWAKRDVWNEVTIHDIEMDPVGARRIDIADFVAEFRKIGRQNRRGNDQRAYHRMFHIVALPAYQKQAIAAGLERSFPAILRLKHFETRHRCPRIRGRGC